MMVVEVKSTVLDRAESGDSSFFQRLNIGSAVFYQIQSPRARFLQDGGYWNEHRLDERRTFHIESGRMTRSVIRLHGGEMVSDVLRVCDCVGLRAGRPILFVHPGDN